MTVSKQLQLAKSRTGRIKLHMLSAIRDFKIVWHLQGIMRELNPI